MVPIWCLAYGSRQAVDISGNTKALPDGLYQNHTPSQYIHTGLRARMSNQSSLETSCLKLFCYSTTRTIRTGGVSRAQSALPLERRYFDE